MELNNLEISDETLVQRAISGDQGAYSALNGRYRQKLEIYLSDILGNDTQELPDIIQLTLLKAFNNLHKFEPTYKFSTWLYNIAKNTAIDSLRKRKVNMERGFFQTVDIAENLSGNKSQSSASPLSKSPEEEYISMQSYALIKQRINALEPKYREIAELRFLKELAYDEISSIVGLPLNTVRTRIKRAKNQLKDLDLSTNE